MGDVTANPELAQQTQPDAVAVAQQELGEAHRQVQAMAARLAEARARVEALAETRARRIAAGEPPDGNADATAEKAEREAADLARAVDLLAGKHRAAIRALHVAEAQAASAQMKEMQARQGALRPQMAEVRQTFLRLQAEHNDLENKISQIGHATHPRPLRKVLEGTPDEIRAAVAGGPDWGIHPATLAEALGQLQAELARAGLGPGRDTASRVQRLTTPDGRLLIPALGRVRIEFDPDNGQLKQAAILEVWGIEGQSVAGALGGTTYAPRPGAVAAPLPPGRW